MHDNYEPAKDNEGLIGEVTDLIGVSTDSNGSFCIEIRD